MNLKVVEKKMKIKKKKKSKYLNNPKCLLILKKDKKFLEMIGVKHW